jgi:selenide,water dikinase
VIGLGLADDAAVWRVDGARLLVVTTDFFTPIVDDPYDFGAIAAANSLSDVYAMGGRPFLGLNVTALPTDLPIEIAQEILRGGAEKAAEAGVVIAGGHTVQDREPKYGLVALGWADSDRLMTRSGFRAGQMLFLTKPLGTGVTTTAIQRSQAEAEHVREVVAWMKRLNGRASRLAIEFGVRGATDITGFGLLGHGSEVAAASGCRLHLRAASIPLLSGAAMYARSGFYAGGTRDNRDHFEGGVDFEDPAPDDLRMLLFDAQTSGGLLLSVPADRAQEFVAAAAMEQVPAWPVGTVEPGQGVRVSAGTMDGWERVSAGQEPGVAFFGPDERRRGPRSGEDNEGDRTP